MASLNAPTGAWCSLTRTPGLFEEELRSQCTYRCVVPPDAAMTSERLVLDMSQCTYRCVVLPDFIARVVLEFAIIVSMHLQVRGAP